jgi:hypothetical protein
MTLKGIVDTMDNNKDSIIGAKRMDIKIEVMMMHMSNMARLNIIHIFSAHIMYSYYIFI